MVTSEGSSTEILVETSRDMDWTCLGLLSRWKKVCRVYWAKEKYRGVFEIQKSGDKTSSGEIGLDIRTHASPKVGQDQVSGGVSVLCWHAAPVAYVPWNICYYLNYIVPFGDFSIDHIFCWLCIFIECHLVTLTFDLCTQKCIQLFYKLLSINWPNMRKIRSKMAEKSQNAESGKEIK